jgi:uncharacterized protein involved in exopolysaccharide biosynthesis
VVITQKNNSNNADDEFDFYRLTHWVKQYYKILFVFILAGLFTGYLATMVLAPEWEATATIKIGQLGFSENAVLIAKSGDSFLSGKLIENNLEVTDRVNSPSFRNEIMEVLKLHNEMEIDHAKLLLSSLRAKTEKSGLITLSLRGMTKKQAHDDLRTVVSHLIKIHKGISQPTINKWKEELSILESEAKSSRLASEHVRKSIESSQQDKSVNLYALINHLIATKEKQDNNLERIYKLKDRLSQDRTFSTTIMGQIIVPNSPVYPNKTLCSILGMLIGFLGSIIFIYCKSKYIAR